MPAEVQAAVDRVRGQKTLIILAARAYLDRKKGAALLTHDIAHLFWDTLPPETQQALRELHRQEIAAKSGPLYLDGKLKERMAYVEEDNERGHKEWFAERTARLNESWVKGRMDLSERSLLRRVAFQLREMLRRLWVKFANAEGIDPTDKLFTDAFRQFVGSGANAKTGHRAGAEFAQSLMALDTPLGIDLPNEIRNLQPRWQDKVLRFDSALDKALYYAGGENTATRENVAAQLTDQTGLSAGQIAALARILRTKLRALTNSTAADGTIRVPAQMRQDVVDLTGTEFATGNIQNAQLARAATQRQRLRPGAGTNQIRTAAQEFLNRPLRNLESDTTATISRESLGKMLSASSVLRSTDAEAHRLAVANADHLFEIAVLRESRPDRDKDRHVGQLHHFVSVLPTTQGPRRINLLVKEYSRPQDGRRIYTLRTLEIMKPASSREPAITGETDAKDSPPAGFEGKMAALARAVNEDAERVDFATAAQTTPGDGIDPETEKTPPRELTPAQQRYERRSISASSAQCSLQTRNRITPSDRFPSAQRRLATAAPSDQRR